MKIFCSNVFVRGQTSLSFLLPFLVSEQVTKKIFVIYTLQYRIDSITSMNCSVHHITIIPNCLHEKMHHRQETQEHTMAVPPTTMPVLLQLSMTTQCTISGLHRLKTNNYQTVGFKISHSYTSNVKFQNCKICSNTITIHCTCTSIHRKKEKTITKKKQVQTEDRSSKKSGMRPSFEIFRVGRVAIYLKQNRLLIREICSFCQLKTKRFDRQMITHLKKTMYTLYTRW